MNCADRDIPEKPSASLPRPLCWFRELTLKTEWPIAAMARKGAIWRRMKSAPACCARFLVNIFKLRSVSRALWVLDLELHE